MDADAMEIDFVSPFIIERMGTGEWKEKFPSRMTISGLIGILSRRRFSANSVAPFMFRRSTVRWETRMDDVKRALARMRSSAGHSLPVAQFFRVVDAGDGPVVDVDEGRVVDGDADAERDRPGRPGPTSSTPAMSGKPSSSSCFSIAKVGTNKKADSRPPFFSSMPPSVCDLRFQRMPRAGISGFLLGSFLQRAAASRRRR